MIKNKFSSSANVEYGIKHHFLDYVSNSLYVTKSCILFVWLENYILWLERFWPNSYGGVFLVFLLEVYVFVEGVLL